MKQYHLDAAWYYGAVGLAWDAASKFTGIKLELLTDVDMLTSNGEEMNKGRNMPCPNSVCKGK